MSLPDYITGRDVVVNGVPTLGHIYYKRLVDGEPTFHSGAGGGADMRAGNTKLEGFYWAYGHTPPVFPPVQNDDAEGIFELRFTENGTNANTATYVMCRGIEIVVPTHDKAKKNLVYYIVHFTTYGYDLAYESGALPTDTATPAAYPVAGLGCLLDDAEETGIQNMRLRIWHNGPEKVNSGTNGIYTTLIGNLDWEFRYLRDVNALSLLSTKAAPNAIRTIKMKVTSDPLYWTLAYGRLMVHATKIDRETNEPLEVEVVARKCMNGTDIGYVYAPGDSQKWPAV